MSRGKEQQQPSIVNVVGCCPNHHILLANKNNNKVSFQLICVHHLTRVIELPNPWWNNLTLEQTFT